jgi:hypothetical protein
MPLRISLICAAAALLAMTVAAPAADTRGAVELSGGSNVPQNPSPPKLNLTDVQRDTIRKAVLTRHTEVEFNEKATKPAEDFTPAVGAKLPAPIKATPMPQALLAQLPQLADYDYVKVKNQVLIVNMMNKTIVDMFPETHS